MPRLAGLDLSLPMQASYVAGMTATCHQIQLVVV
jgi:hypothetical protein